MDVIDYWIVGIYLLVILALGLNAGRKVHTLTQFSVASRSYGTFVVFATLSASFIGGGFTMGNAGKVYEVGIINIIAIWGFSLKEILVSLYLAPRMKHFPNAISAGDVTGEAYGKPIKVLTGVFGIMLCIAIVGAQVGAIGTIFKVFLGLEPWLGIAIGCSILIIYSTFGGMRAVVVTDILQFIMLAIGLPLVLVFGVIAVGGVSETVQAIPAERFDTFANGGVIALVSLFFVLFLGEALVPPYLQRLMIGSPEKVARGTLLSGIFSIPFFVITGCIGLVAYAMNPALEKSNEAIPHVLNESVPIGLKGLIIAGIVSIAMSSADSFLNSAAVSLSNDVIKPLKKRPISDKAHLLIARCTTAIGGLLAVYFAVSIASLLDILIYAYNFWAPVILPPLVAAIFGFRAKWQLIICAAIAGISANVIWAKVLDAPAGIDGLILGVLANILVLVIGYQFVKHQGRVES